MAPTIPPEPWEVDRLTRGRDLTEREIAEYLASRQTALRHATADVGTEIAEKLRDRLGETPPGPLDALRLTAAIKTVLYGGGETMGNAYRDAEAVAAEYERLTPASPEESRP